MNPLLSFDIINNDSLKLSINELQQISIKGIQVNTAILWANRACAAMHLDKIDDAREYAHEAVEHAALSGNLDLLNEIYKHFSDYGIVI